MFALLFAHWLSAMHRSPVRNRYSSLISFADERLEALEILPKI
jgi:hypothetical protein